MPPRRGIALARCIRASPRRVLYTVSGPARPVEIHRRLWAAPCPGPRALSSTPVRFRRAHKTFPWPPVEPEKRKRPVTPTSRMPCSRPTPWPPSRAWRPWPTTPASRSTPSTERRGCGRPGSLASWPPTRTNSLGFPIGHHERDAGAHGAPDRVELLMKITWEISRPDGLHFEERMLEPPQNRSVVCFSVVYFKVASGRLELLEYPEEPLPLEIETEPLRHLPVLCRSGFHGEPATQGGRPSGATVGPRG